MSRRMSDRVLQDQFWNAYYDTIDLILINLTWFLCSVPLITAIPALGGLFHATNRLAHGSGGNWRVFWEGFRQHFWLSWRWGLINAAVFIVLGVSYEFYSQLEIPALSWIRWPILIAGAIWAELQLFTFPLLLEQTDRRFLIATRNSAVLFLRCPGLALSALVPVLIIGAVSLLVFLPAWVVISASLCAYLANRAVVKTIERLKPPAAA
ncbi:MAG: YesL family protein [Anaerolineae bacterium]|nr:YesL family protein [Anaerolineae bacterium]